MFKDEKEIAKFAKFENDVDFERAYLGEFCFSRAETFRVHAPSNKLCNEINFYP